MSSKLFHTVVAFGITIGAASVGCAAEPVETPETSEAAVVSTDEATPAPVAAPEKDRFCEVAWPTTKGGPRPSFACVDAQNECGEYPGVQFGSFWSSPTCFEAATATDGATCSSAKEVWMFCKTTPTGGHEWACPGTTVKSDQCVWPAPADENVAEN